MTCSFEQARALVLQQARQRRTLPAAESIPTLEAAGRILAEDIATDAAQPVLSEADFQTKLRAFESALATG